MIDLTKLTTFTYFWCPPYRLNRIRTYFPRSNRKSCEIFIDKLFRLTSSDDFPAIQWSSDGGSIMINQRQFEPLIGSLCRRSTKFSTFLRQLHLYGFRKTTRTNPRENSWDHCSRNIWVYRNPDFHRDHPEKVKLIGRAYYHDLQPWLEVKKEEPQEDDKVDVAKVPEDKWVHASPKSRWSLLCGQRVSSTV